MEKKLYHWLTLQNNGVFDGLKVKTAAAEEKNMIGSIRFEAENIAEAKHLMYLLQACIKANYPKAVTENWYPDLPKKYQNMIEDLKYSKH